MAVHIQLDKPHTYFTNLDFITGKVLLTTFTAETISAINVKLECESRTRLATPPRDRNRSQTEIEVHKLLYKVQTVFPSPAVLQQNPNSSTFTLPSGSHEYPFHLKIPFNNACNSVNSMLSSLDVSRMEMVRDTNRHVKKPLPPTLTGFPDEAEIRYFVKVTVQRPAFYKENFRATADFKFLPIEPPRPPPNRLESYARREHQFAPHIPVPLKSTILRKPSASSASRPPPKISIDCRLPNPAIITCNEPLPLRVIIKKLNDTPEIIYLQLLQIQLIGYTRIRAHELDRQEASSWLVVSLANLHTPLGNSNTPPNKEMEIDRRLWGNIPLPNSIPPTFETCNLSRHYVLEIRVGLVHGSTGKMKPELTVQPLRMPVDIYSGVKPPPALLAEMARRVNSLPCARPSPQPHPRPGSFPPSSASSSQPPPFTPSSRPSSSSTAYAPPSTAIPDEAPPSYEDALAEDLAPVDGPRREYNQPQASPIIGDSKRGSAFGGNERLFP